MRSLGVIRGGANSAPDNSLSGLGRFLFNCPSVDMAMAIQGCIKKVVGDDNSKWDQPLTEQVLESVRQEIYARNKDKKAGEIDIFLMLTDAMFGKPSGRTSNPFESRLQFIENLQQQLREGSPLNFQKAFDSAMSLGR